MQNLKFKVFYEPSGKIYDVLAMDFIKRHVTIEYKKGKTQVVGMDFCKIMQYTGMNDHNGVEIYDGYIVFYCSPSKGCINFDGEFFICFCKEAGVFKAVSLKYPEDIKYHLGGIASFSSVVGNIYENKELLG